MIRFFFRLIASLQNVNEELSAKSNYASMIYLNSISLEPYISKGAQPKLTKKKLGDVKVPVPSSADLIRIVGILEQFDVLTTCISQGLPAEVEARRRQYAYYRDKLLSFKEKVA